MPSTETKLTKEEMRLWRKTMGSLLGCSQVNPEMRKEALRRKGNRLVGMAAVMRRKENTKSK